MLPLLKSYLVQIYTKLKRVKDTKLTELAETPKSKLDPKKVTEFMIIELSKKLLNNVKTDLEALYLKDRELEKTLIPHTTKHSLVMERINQTRVNLAVVNDEIHLLHMNSTNNMANITKDLGLKDYIYHP